VIEAAWSAVTVSVLRRDPAAASAAVPAAVREGLLQTAGPAALLAVQSGTAGREVEALITGLQDRDWPGDDVLIELLAAVMAGTVTGRVPLAVELDTLGDVLNDQRGGSVDLGAGTVWPAELVDDGQVEGLESFEESDPELWLDVPGEGSRDAYGDMVDFTAEIIDTRARDDLAAALEGKGAFADSRARWTVTRLTGSTGGCSPPNAAPAGPEPGSPTRATTPSPDQAEAV